MSNLAHQILLWNHTARRRLRPGRGGPAPDLGRSLFEFLARDAVAAALERLLERPDSAQTISESFPCAMLNGNGSLTIRIGLVLNPASVAEGYVVTFAGNGAAVGPAPAEALPRPEFYDFDLFHRPVTGAALTDRPLRELSYVVFDTETTGLNPRQGDEIVSVAGLRIVNGRILAADPFDRLVDPGRPIPPASTRIHGITTDMVRGMPRIEAVLPAFQASATRFWSATMPPST